MKSDAKHSRPNNIVDQRKWLAWCGLEGREWAKIHLANK